MKFWNREKEVKYLKAYLESEPNAILFVYGPKSSGKSTLLEYVVKEMENEKRYVFWDRYRIYWFDLRRRFIPNYETVVDMFFVDREVMEKVMEKGGKTRIGILPFFTVEVEEKEMIRLKNLRKVKI